MHLSVYKADADMSDEPEAEASNKQAGVAAGSQPAVVTTAAVPKTSQSVHALENQQV